MGKPRKLFLGPLVAVAAGGIFLYAGYKLTSKSAGGAVSGTISPPTAAAPGRSDSAPGQFDTSAHEALMLEAALKKKPDHKPLLFRLAQLDQEAGRKADAERRLREILRTEPADADALLELGKLLFERGDVHGAVDMTNRILSKNPDHPDALYNLGAVYANLGDAAKAREYWSRLIAAHPDSESAGRARQMLRMLTTP